MEVSLACVVLRSAGRSVAGWWLGGVVRCGCLAGSVLWGPGRVARAGGSGRRPWGCPPWGPVPSSRVLWGFWSLGLVAVAVPSCPLWVFQSPLWGWGVGHRSQPLGLHHVVGRGGGSGAGLDGDGGRGVPRPWVGLAGGGGGLWGLDDGALGDGDVDEDSDGVVLGGRLCGGGGCRWGGGRGLWWVGGPGLGEDFG